MIHELKIWPEYFREVESENKKAEIRLDDRPYEVGDCLHLREWDYQTETYTGNYVLAKITHVFRDANYIREGYLQLSISLYYGFLSRAEGELIKQFDEDGGMYCVDCPVCEASNTVHGELSYEPDRMFCSSEIFAAECGCDIQEHSVYSKAVARMQERHYQLKKQYA